MVNSDYTVKLEAFEGPLDLLLFLIRRAEVEIHDIPIAAITEQYIAFLEQLSTTDGRPGRRIDIEQAGEFLVMAATLMEIKSRMLAPKAAGPGGDGDDRSDGSAPADAAELDPRAELVRQLLEYKRYRDATDRLEEWRSEWEHRYPSARVVVGRPAEIPCPDDAQPEERVDVDDLQLIDLVEAFARVVESVDFSRVGEHRVLVDDTPVEVHGERIVQRLREAEAAAGHDREGARVLFRSLFKDRSRAEMIGLFLAILEMVKQQRVLVEQDPASAEIVLRLGAALDPATDVAGSAVAASG